MANLPAAKKSIRVTKRRTARNEKLRNRIESLTRKTLKLIETGEAKLADQQFQSAQKAIDKAAKNRVIHPNKASRMKSRLAKKLNNLNNNVETAPKNS
jgi:small subunit ribosomal protein S20